MKYIVVEKDGLPVIVVFSETVTHAQMAGLVSPHHRPTSAGFVGSDLKPYGESISLGIKKVDSDDKLFKRQFKPYEDD